MRQHKKPTSRRLSPKRKKAVEDRNHEVAIERYSQKLEPLRQWLARLDSLGGVGTWPGVKNGDQLAAEFVNLVRHLVATTSPHLE